MDTADLPNYRHSLVTRVTHGTFGLAFAGLVLTGVQVYLHAHWLRDAVLLHEIFACVTIVSGVVYVAYAALTGKLGALFFGSRDVAGLVPMALYYLKLRPTPPEFSEYNPLQKLAYTIVLFMLAPLIVATGLAMWPHLGLFRPLAHLFGGRKAAALWHLGFALELVLFFFGHMVMVATTGLRANLRAIVTGYGSPPVPRASMPVRAAAQDDTIRARGHTRVRPARPTVLELKCEVQVLQAVRLLEHRPRFERHLDQMRQLVVRRR